MSYHLITVFQSALNGFTKAIENHLGDIHPKRDDLKKKWLVVYYSLLNVDRELEELKRGF